MLNCLRKFDSLRADQQAILCHALILVVAMRVGLWTLPFRILQGAARRASDRATWRRRWPAEAIPFLARAVALAAGGVPVATCLTQALAAQFLLARAGYPSLLRIGVLHERAGTFKAHAWLECNGRLIIGDVPRIEDFTPLPTL